MTVLDITTTFYLGKSSWFSLSMLKKTS